MSKRDRAKEAAVQSEHRAATAAFDEGFDRLGATVDTAVEILGGGSDVPDDEVRQVMKEAADEAELDMISQLPTPPSGTKPSAPPVRASTSGTLTGGSAGGAGEGGRKPRSVQEKTKSVQLSSLDKDSLRRQQLEQQKARAAVTHERMGNVATTMHAMAEDVRALAEGQRVKSAPQKKEEDKGVLATIGAALSAIASLVAAPFVALHKLFSNKVEENRREKQFKGQATYRHADLLSSDGELTDMEALEAAEKQADKADEALEEVQGDLAATLGHSHDADPTVKDLHADDDGHTSGLR